MDRIFIKDLEIEMSIGIYEEEKIAPQRVIISISLDINTPAEQSDNIDDTVSYKTVIDDIKTLATARHYNLVESFAEEIATSCLKDKRVKQVEVEVTKPDIFIDAAGVGICIIRKQKN